MTTLRAAQNHDVGLPDRMIDLRCLARRKGIGVAKAWRRYRAAIVNWDMLERQRKMKRFLGRPGV